MTVALTEAKKLLKLMLPVPTKWKTIVCKDSKIENIEEDPEIDWCVVIKTYDKN